MVDVVSIKMISGEEIITIVKSSSDMILVLNNPLSFVMQYNPENNSKGDVAFAPWMIGIEPNSDVPVSKNHILTMCNPSSEARTAYLNAIGYKEDRNVVPMTAKVGRGSKAAIGTHRSAPHASA